MRCPARLHTALVSIVALGLLAPPQVRAEGQASVPAAPATTPASEPLVVDIALQDGGALTGSVVAKDGTCAAQETVYVLQQGTVVGTCQTHASGDFAMTGLTGGVYEVRWANGVTLCRLWAPQTAPPSANSNLVLTANALVVRGQTGTPSPGRSLLKGPLPWIAAAVVVTGLIWWDVVAAQKHRYERDHPKPSAS